jgi:murein DD-endopeptidase MepM/ murein hydrolase activator NlpD
MARTLYRYNPETCAYEPIFSDTKKMARKTGLFLGLAVVLAAIAVAWYTKNNQSWDEKMLLQQNALLKADWEILEEKISASVGTLNQIESNDDETYRILLDMPKLDSSIRKGGAGGHEDYALTSQEKKLSILQESYGRLHNINNRLTVEDQSLAEIGKEIQLKEEMMVTRPAMQPIDNRQLTRFNSIFGMRMHPIFNEWRNHNGLDLTAPYGTPVYASGNGYVTRAEIAGGYGNVIFVNHGFGFETRYAHLSKYNVTSGQRVKRGDLIGFVGSTGTSTAPHLHYEVIYKGKFINPITFLYRDLKQEEYDKLIHDNVDELEQAKFDRHHF